MLLCSNAAFFLALRGIKFAFTRLYTQFRRHTGRVRVQVLIFFISKKKNNIIYYDKIRQKKTLKTANFFLYCMAKKQVNLFSISSVLFAPNDENLRS